MASIYKRGNIFWIRFKFNKKRHQFSLGITDIATAKKLLDVYSNKLKSARATNKLQKELNSINNAIDSSLTNKNSGDKMQDWIAIRWAKFNSREKQAVVFVMFGGKCYYCGRDVTIPASRKDKTLLRAVMDHKIPVAGGGSNNLPNLVLSCEACNIKKSDDTPEKFVKELQSDLIIEKI